MGQNKAHLELGRATLLEHVIAAATEVTERVCLVANDATAYESLGLPVVADGWPGKGALNGLATALSHSSTEHTLVLACDLPFVSAGFLGWILEHREQAEVVVPQTADGRLHPLAAVYSRDCLEPARGCLEQGRLKVISFFDQVRVLRLTEPMQRAAGHDPGQLINLNTPEDHRRAVERMSRGPA